jgi:signal transduction histidine kinase
LAKPSTWNTPGEIALLAVVYVCLAKLGLMMGAVSGFATLVWPATGVALAGLVKRGTHLWPGVAIGAFVTNVWVGAPLPVALGIACGNTLEALLGAWALQRIGGGKLTRLRHMVGLILAAAAGSTLVSAAFGVGSLRLGGIVGAAQAPATFRAWWVGDAIGGLVVAPLLLSLADREARWPRGARLAEAILLGLLLAAGSMLVFSGELPRENAFAQVYVLFPLLAWAALRFQLRGATLATLVVSTIAVWCTALGLGPFARGALADSLLFLQVFMAMVAVTTLLLAAAIGERDRAVRMRDSLLAIVSHDLKSPLHAIDLNAQILSRRLATGDASTQRHVALLKGSVERMAALVRDLLDTAALDAGELSLEPTDVEVHSLVNEALEATATAAQQSGRSLRRQLPDGALWARCDRRRVVQVLVNLLDNAVKFAPRSTTITVAAAARDGDIELSVSDLGAGIAADELARVFDPFWRAPSGRQAGSGLGLAIAKKLVEAHGGRLWVESEPGRGSTFRFLLPSGPAPAPRKRESFLVDWSDQFH